MVAPWTPGGESPFGCFSRQTAVMDREDAETVARALVAGRFPEARAAWLAGSVVAGTATPTSDLDLTVLLPGRPAPFRESLVHDGWPVELFVHTAGSVDHWLAKDRARRRPTLGRLIGEGRLLLDVDGAGAAVAGRCRAFLAAGPEPLSDGDRDALRYGLTDLLDDLADAAAPAVRAAVAVELWRQAADLLLAAGGGWGGTGKWLVRELAAYDATHGTLFGPRLHDGLVAAVTGDPGPLARVTDEVLAVSGGRLWAGYRVSGPVPSADDGPGAGGRGQRAWPPSRAVSASAPRRTASRRGPTSAPSSEG